MSSDEKITKTNTRFIKRKFPGPAGLLPEVKKHNLEKELNVANISSQIIFCSQSSFNNFSDGTWLEMLEDLKQKNHQNLPEKYNVDWIIKNSKTGFFNDQKIPFLAVKIKQLETIGKSPNFILCDPTGEISGVISDDLYEQFSEFLHVNSVLILKNCSLLTLNITKKLYIVITFNNLIKIYSFFNDPVVKKGNENSELQIVTVNEFNFDDQKSLNENVNPKKFKSNEIKEDSSFVILSQSSQTNINDVRDALNAINATNFFDDF